MRILALDVGTRRTGIAFLDEDVGVPVPLLTVRHRTEEELLARVAEVVRERKVERVIVGLPLLLDGTDGSQTLVARRVGAAIAESGVHVTFLDERYTTPQVRSPKALRHAPPPSAYDGDAAAACALLLR